MDYPILEFFITLFNFFVHFINIMDNQIYSGESHSVNKLVLCENFIVNRH